MSMEGKELKQAFVERLRDMIGKQPHILQTLADIDQRIADYIMHVVRNCEGDKDVHNIDEVAACCKMMRMAAAYDINHTEVRKFIRMYEQFYFSGISGRQRYRMTMIQTFMVCGIFGFATDGRRTCREAILFIPRKFAKTTFDAALSVYDFLFGDSNGEVHIVANAHDQAKIAYKEAKALAMQLDPDGRQIRFTADTFNWREGQAKSSSVSAHTSGGKTKDGAFASLVIADEYGSAAYVKDHCDMSDALNVYESSMGPRLNPLTVITTTAGRVIEGPFEQKLRVAQQSLYRELELTYDERCATDWQFLVSLHPDSWECTDTYLAQPRVHLKCNPHIGVTVQPSYYEEYWQKAQNDPEVKKEVLTKLFNQFVSNSSRPWLQSSDIRKLQVSRRVTDLTNDWLCWVAMDFSKGDDLCSIAYNCYNPKSKQYFWDADAWIAEQQIHSNPNAVLYQQWQQEGWLHVCKGQIIDETSVLSRVDEVSKHVRIVGIGYDPYDSMRYVNLFQTWIVGKLRQQGKGQRYIEDFIKRCLQSVSQTWGSFNASTQVMWDLVKWTEQRVFISPNPMIPYCFGNCVLDEDRLGNCKPIKRTQNAKIDIAICLLMGIIMQDRLKL